MFKYVLSLTFAVGLATAGTITATCDGVTTLGSTSASCSGPGPVSAMIQTNPSFAASASANAQTIGSGSMFTSASVSGDFVFTVFGGTGQGSFYPCFIGGGNHTAMEQGVFDGIMASLDGNPGVTSNCFGNGTGLFPLSRPFTVGVPQVVLIGIGVSALAQNPFLAVGAGLSLGDILFFDASLNLLPNVTYTLVSTSVPEPSPWSLLGIGLMWLLALPIRGMRLWARFH